MALDTQIHVFLDGTLFTRIDNFQLQENVGQHTQFSVSVRGAALEHNINGHSVLDSSRHYLGKRFSIEISGLNNLGYKDFHFEGIITQVRGRKGNETRGLGDMIDIVGYSNSILLDDGPHMNSFLENNLSAIVERATKDYTNHATKIVCAPENDTIINYAVQNKQSTFAYLQYLAASNGEYLLYNTDRLYFGKPNLGDSITLKYGVDLKDFSLGLEAKSLNFSYFSNDYFSESSAHAAGASKNSNASGYTAAVSNMSLKTFPNTNQRLYSTYEDSNLQQRIDTAVALQKKLAEQQQVTLHGESTNTGISLGKTITIESPDGTFGSYRITHVTHTCSYKGHYRNTFTAIPLEIDIYPLTDIAIVNKAQAQIAKVVDNADPDGLSRIKVQFPWQKMYSQTTPWLRIATPYAGGDRGFLFLPEVGDEVLIGFENGEVERPFMQAALYTGVNKHSGWQSQNNGFKGMTTKGGHVIELKDTPGGEMITITDKNSNTIQLDTSNSSIVISAAENLIFQAKNIDMRATENIRVTAAKNKMENIGGNYMLEATNIFEVASGEMKSKAEDILKQASNDVTITSESGNVNKQASGKINNNSGEQSNLF